MKRLLRAAVLFAPLLLTVPVQAEPAGRVPAVPAPAINLAVAPISRTDLPWWRERFDRSLERTQQGHVDLIWLGDSITQNWELAGPEPFANYRPVWNRFYGDRAAVNMGFRGDTTANVIWRLEHGEVAGLNPKALVLLIGANNFGRVHWDAEKSLAGIDSIIHILRHKLPNTRILLLGVLPSERSPWITENTDTLNGLLATEYRNRPYVTFMNVGRLFYRGGQLNRGLYLDPHEALLARHEAGLTTATVSSVALHPDAQGMALIAEAIEPALHRLMNDRDHLRAPAG
ncbi:MAG TPA: GDSL-type esterase/lipase family protein [Acidisoma sp.]|nr:GDSL-type esterase/lipase family protein [Acidisoma sp.]